LNGRFLPDGVGVATAARSAGLNMFRASARRTVHEWHVWRLVETEYLDRDGSPFVRTFIESPGAVSVVAVDDALRVVLIRQWRASLDRVVWEVPAGMRDRPGEAPDACGLRELEEETGYRASNAELLTCFHPSAGVMNGTHHVYLATGLSFVGASHDGPEEAELDVVLMPFDEALAMVERGEITASSAVIGLTMAARRLGR
jgi:ADP-ribose pyrophosphatase